MIDIIRTDGLSSALGNCSDVTEVRILLDKHGIDEDLGVRASFLFNFMGIRQMFSCTDGTYKVKNDDVYNLACEHLISTHNKQ